MKQISVRQICLLFLAFVPVTKVILMPAVLARFAGHRLWMSALFAFLAEGLTVAALAWLATAHRGTFFELLEGAVGRVGAKIVYALYALFYILKACLLVIEQKNFLDTVLYETTPSLLNFLPFFFLAAFAAAQGTKVLGRVADVCFWATASALAVILPLSLVHADFRAVLPLFYGMFPSSLRGGLASLTWFGEASYLLFFLGKIKLSRRPIAKIALSYAAAAAVTVFFLIVFVALFEGAAENFPYAIARTGKYSIALSNMGRMDLFAVLVLIGSMTAALIAPLMIAAECLSEAFGLPRAVPALAASLLPLAALLAFARRFEDFLRFSAGALSWFYLFMGIVLPLLCCLLPRKRAAGGAETRESENGAKTAEKPQKTDPGPKKRETGRKKEATRNAP